MTIIETLKQNRPNISESSLKTYNSTLTNFYYLHHPKKQNIDINWFNNQDDIIDLIGDTENKKRIYAALIAITDDKNNDKYKIVMYKDINDYNIEQNKQEKTEKQKKNWINQDKIIEIYNKLNNDYSYLLNKKKLNYDEFFNLQNYIIASLYVLNEPRRLKDFTELKIKGNINKKDDNYIDDNEFVFNNYKTKKTYHEQRIKINDKLKKILNKYIKINPFEYLLVDINGNKLTSPKLNTRLNNIFGKYISVNLLRHSLLTDKYKNLPNLEELQETAKNLGHSIPQLFQYIKKD
jgi:hypothetical protein